MSALNPGDGDPANQDLHAQDTESDSNVEQSESRTVKGDFFWELSPVAFQAKVVKDEVTGQEMVTEVLADITTPYGISAGEKDAEFLEALAPFINAGLTRDETRKSGFDYTPMNDDDEDGDVFISKDSINAAINNGSLKIALSEEDKFDILENS